jgi:hypothetical protein
LKGKNQFRKIAKVKKKIGIKFGKKKLRINHKKKLIQKVFSNKTNKNKKNEDQLKI